VSYYVRHLPHWHPDSACFFITWRLYQSLPREVLRGRAAEGAGRAFAALDRYLDTATSGPLWLKDERVADCVAQVLRLGGKDWGLYELRAWVVMPNHVHALLHPHRRLAEVMCTIKSASARCANQILRRVGEAFWQDESFDRWVRNADERERTVRYIEHNPVKAGLVHAADEWRWSSAFAEGASRAGASPAA
jgi:putative DNA methylase